MANRLVLLNRESAIRPFFSYAGAKWRMAKMLGPPVYDRVIEPFAGSACYSCYHAPRHVSLIDRSPIVCGVWDYLINASRRDIAQLPDRVLHVDDLPSPLKDTPAEWLIGFWLDHCSPRPGISMCNWGRNSVKWRDYWGPHIKRRIIEQQPGIRHWTINEGNYWDAPDVEAHWHIDPPYQHSGGMYPFHDLDYYGALAPWCLSRHGFVQVHDGLGADWLPFKFFAAMSSHRPLRLSFEYLYERDNRHELKIADTSNQM